MHSIKLKITAICFGMMLVLPMCGAAEDDSTLKKRPVDYPNFQEIKNAHAEMPAIISRYSADLDTLNHTLPNALSPAKAARLKMFYSDWKSALANRNFDDMSQEDKIDYLLLKNHLTYELRQLNIRQKELDEQAPLLPFANKISSLSEARESGATINPSILAAEITNLTKQIEDTQRQVEAGLQTTSNSTANLKSIVTTKKIAYRAEKSVRRLEGLLREWYDFYHGYDPLFTWWLEVPYKSAGEALRKYETMLHEKVIGAAPGNDDIIIGDPIGKEALLNDLANEMIPYSPDELIQIANKEYAWCEVEMKKASHDLGFGDDWKQALEHVKTLHVEPGAQVKVIRDLAEEATKFVEAHDLVTVPALARNGWRVQMMSADAQKTNPFFLGGDDIIVSFPTNTMTQEQKMMSLRGNNVHFARATVFHELIPGHHLQGYSQERYHAYRQPFNTPFWVEGWALHWEMLFWDMGFQKTPEDRVGALFWRMHRCARIIFSLNFHLGKMAPQECIDLLVEKVGHERANAEAEVRRSLNGSYPPLYQAAYMLGALQIRQLHKELVDSGKMTNRDFHDAVLHENSIPIELIRADLTKQNLNREFTSNWRFYEK